MRPDILLCVEHVARELDIACALKFMVQRDHGLRVEICSITAPPAVSDPPRVIAVPYFLSAEDFGLPPLLRRFPDTPYVNLAFEQVLFHANAQFKRPRDQVAKHHVMHLASGDFFGQHLITAGVNPRHVCTVGSLACSLYLPRYRDYSRVPRDQLAEAHGLDRERPWIFFPENFGAAFFKNSQIRHRARRGFDAAALHTYRQFARESFAEIMRWCSAAVQKSEAELIIRPRPSTPCSEFTRQFAAVTGHAQLDRLHFIKDGGVREWILASDSVVSSFSTSLIEAAVADKPVWLLTPFEVPDCLRSEWLNHVPRIEDEAAFQRLMQDPRTPAANTQLKQWSSDQLLAFGDPLHNVAQLLADVCHGRTGAAPPPRPHAATRAQMWISESLRWCERRVRACVRPGHRQKSRLHEADAFAASDIQRRVARWARHLSHATEKVA